MGVLGGIERGSANQLVNQAINQTVTQSHHHQNIHAAITHRGEAFRSKREAATQCLFASIFQVRGAALLVLPVQLITLK